MMWDKDMGNAHELEGTDASKKQHTVTREKYLSEDGLQNNQQMPGMPIQSGVKWRRERL